MNGTYPETGFPDLEPFTRDEAAGVYVAKRPLSPEDLIGSAVAIAWRRWHAFPLARDPAELARAIALEASHSEVELFGIIGLTAHGEIVGREILHRGGLDRVHVHTSEIARWALRAGASRVYAWHSHGRGHAQPSAADLKLHDWLAAILSHPEIELIDSFIVAGPEYCFMTDWRRAHEAFTDPWQEFLNQAQTAMRSLVAAVRASFRRARGYSYVRTSYDRKPSEPDPARRDPGGRPDADL